MNSTVGMQPRQKSERGQNSKAAALEKSRESRMEPTFWVPPDAVSLLDVGCNIGALLCEFRRRYPKMQLAGIDINRTSIQIARANLPNAEIHEAFGFDLPFADSRFQYVTCIEVIEHIPKEHRPRLLSEIQRVLSPGGQLILRCPHAGIFEWLDAQNMRFRFPRLYNALVGEGKRDSNYREAQEELIWHHHFTREELLGVAGDGWQLEACHFGGLVLFPISDIIRWPFYRMKWSNNWIVKALEKVATAELALDFGQSSFDILVVLRKL